MLFFFLFSILGVFGRVSLASPHLASGQGEQRSSRDPRIFDIFASLGSSGGLDPVSALSQKNQAKSIRNQRAALEKGCAEFGGKILNGECYQLFHKALVFEDIRKFCQARGGDIWTPSMDDTFIFQKLMHIFPEFSKSSEGGAYIGIEPGTAFDIFGNDMSESLLARPVTCDGCVSYELLEFGTHCLSKCSDYYDTFFCEYPITLQEVQKETILDKVSKFFDFGIKVGK